MRRLVFQSVAVSALLAIGANAAVRPRYGGTLRVEMRAAVQSLAPGGSEQDSRGRERLSALLFESQGQLYGIPLGLVSQVVAANGSFSLLPWTQGPVAGVFPHAQALRPIYSAGALLGGHAEAEAFFLLSELAGHEVGLSASNVLGVHEGFVATEARGEFKTRALSRSALFLDFQRMFS